MTSGNEVNMAAMGVTRIGQAAVLAGAALFHVDAGTAILLAGAIIWAIASWRKDSRDVLRRQNEDVVSRNATLEADVVRLTAALAAANDRPNVDKLYDLMDRHDRHAQKRDDEVISVLKDLGESVRANTEGVRLWATARAQE